MSATNLAVAFQVAPVSVDTIKAAATVYHLATCEARQKWMDIKAMADSGDENAMLRLADTWVEFTAAKRQAERVYFAAIGEEQ